MLANWNQAETALFGQGSARCMKSDSVEWKGFSDVVGEAVGFSHLLC